MAGISLPSCGTKARVSRCRRVPPVIEDAYVGVLQMGYEEGKKILAADYVSDAQAGCILFYRKLKTGFFVMTGFRGGNMPSGRPAECAAEKEAVSLHDSAIY